MAFTTEKLITGDTTLTLSDDGTTWTAEYTVQNRNMNQIDLLIDFTKNLADLELVAYTVDDEVNDDEFEVTKINSSFEIVKDTLTMTEGTSKKRIIFYLSKNEEKIVFKFTPTNATGTDVLKIAVRENSLQA